MCSIPPSISEVAPHIFIGNLSSSLKRPILQANHITAILSLLHVEWSRWAMFIPQDRRLYIPCLDNDTMDILVFMSDACDFIDKQLADVIPSGSSSTTPSKLNDQEPPSKISGQEPYPDRTVLVHCHQGRSRSAAVVVAYLMRKNHSSLEETLAEVKEKRKVKPSKNFMEQLRVWEAVGYEIWEDKEKKIPKPQYQAYLDNRAVRLKAKGRTGNEPIGIVSL